MLSVQERQRTLAFQRYLCTFKLLPGKVDVAESKWSPDPGNRLQSWLCQVSYLVFLLHSAYKILRLVHTMVFLAGTPLHEMVLHGIVASSSAVFAFWYYVLYIKYPEAFAGFLGMTLTGNISRGR